MTGAKPVIGAASHGVFVPPGWAGEGGSLLDGTDYEGGDARGDGATGIVAAAGGLRRAAAALAEATQALRTAHCANGVVRWYDTPQT